MNPTDFFWKVFEVKGFGQAYYFQGVFWCNVFLILKSTVDVGFNRKGEIGSKKSLNWIFSETDINLSAFIAPKFPKSTNKILFWKLEQPKRIWTSSSSSFPWSDFSNRKTKCAQTINNSADSSGVMSKSELMPIPKSLELTGKGKKTQKATFFHAGESSGKQVKNWISFFHKSSYFTNMVKQTQHKSQNNLTFFFIIEEYINGNYWINLIFRLCQ